MAFQSVVESEIKAIIDVGIFQNLCNEILVRELNLPLNSLGSKSGSNKTTFGTPDTYFPDGDKYIFVEYTTTENESTKLFNKINDDIDKCFDESFTNVPLSSITRIIYCHTSSNLTPAQDLQLKTKCAKNNVDLTIYGINEIANKILNHYPSLAETYLHLTIGNGQLYELQGFVEKYNATKQAASLDTKFLFRKEEYTAVHSFLEKQNLVILHGTPGVGKTRLAIEVLNSLKEEYNIICVKNKNKDFGNDFSRFICNDKKNLIFVDDANSLGDRLNTILDLLSDTNQNTKILMTVRESFFNDVKLICSSYSESNSIVIKSFTDKEVEEFLKVTFNINNPLYIQQIQRISEGNARLAYFAAKLSLTEEGYKNIQNAEQLFDAYYGKFLGKELFANENEIKTAGIIAFIGLLNKKSLDTYSTLFSLCNLSIENFLYSCEKLKEREIVNDFKDHCSIDEQCISNYFTYQFLYKKQYFDFSIFLKDCFHLFHKRIVNSLKTIMPIFLSDNFIQYISESVKNVWSFFEGKDDEFDFIKTFCCFVPENSLLHVYKKIQAEKEVSITSVNDIVIENNSYFSKEPIVDLIGCMSSTDKTSELIQLLCLYVQKRQDKVNAVISILKSQFGYDENSHRNRYYKEKLVVESLLDNCTSEILNFLFIEVCKNYLVLSSDSTKEGRHMSMIFTSFSIMDCEESKQIREKIWFKLLEFVNESFCVDRIFNLLESYVSGWNEKDNTVLIEFDSVFVNKLLNILVGFNLIRTVNIVHRYNEKLIHFKLAKIKLEKVNNQFLLDVVETFNGYNFDGEQNDNIKNFLNRNKELDLKVLVQYLKAVNEEKNSNTWHINANFGCFLDFLDNNAFLDIIRLLIQNDTNIGQHPVYYLKRLWTFMAANELYKLINKLGNSNKNEWLFFYYQTIPNQFITDEIYKSFIQYLKGKQDNEIKSAYYRDLSFIENYKNYDENIYITVYSIIKEKFSYNPYIFVIYTHSLFNNELEPEKLCILFQEKIDLLFDIYLLLVKTDSMFDYEGEYLVYLLNTYDSFVENLFLYIKSLFSEFNPSLPESFCNIIKSQKYLSVFEDLVNMIGDLKLDSFFAERLKVLFKNDIERVKLFAKYYMDINYSNKIKLKNLFHAMSEFGWDFKLDLLIYLINKSNDFEIFSSLPLNKTMMTVSGSFVPCYEAEIKFWEGLIEKLPNTIKYIEHKKYCSDKISSLRKRIENEYLEERFMRNLL